MPKRTAHHLSDWLGTSMFNSEFGLQTTPKAWNCNHRWAVWSVWSVLIFLGRLVGWYVTHPDREAKPSRIDIANQLAQQLHHAKVCCLEGLRICSEFVGAVICHFQNDNLRVNKADYCPQCYCDIIVQLLSYEPFTCNKRYFRCSTDILDVVQIF